MWYFSVKSVTTAAGNLKHVVPGECRVLPWLENCQYHDSIKLMQKNFLCAITCLLGPVGLAVGKQLIWDSEINRNTQGQEGQLLVEIGKHSVFQEVSKRLTFRI